MRSIILSLLMFSLWSVFARYHYVCKIKGHCATSTTTATKTERPKTLSLKYLDETILKGYEQFDFAKASISPDLNNNNKDYLDSVVDYLEENPSIRLQITGMMRKSETDLPVPNSSFQENLGFARAEAVEAYLIEKGLDEERITLNSKSTDSDRLLEPMVFNLFDMEIPDDYQKLQFSFHDMTFTDAGFEYNSAEFNPSPQFKLYADSVKTYLSLNEGKALTIIGHADDKGSNTFNDNLGMKRAESTKNYFEELGVEANISVESRGKREPVAANTSDTNRQKNRRVNIKIDTE